jgi:hypothetical protein
LLAGITIPKALINVSTNCSIAEEALEKLDLENRLVNLILVISFQTKIVFFLLNNKILNVFMIKL